MRNVSELTELEAQFVGMLIQTYPAGQGYVQERDPEVRGLTAALVAEGRVERTEIDEEDASGVSYRLTDTFAEQVRSTAANRAAGADLN